METIMQNVPMSIAVAAIGGIECIERFLRLPLKQTRVSRDRRGTFS
jgi:hypothetical protein